jgi:hypothetical protein
MREIKESKTGRQGNFRDAQIAFAFEIRSQVLFLLRVAEQNNRRKGKETKQKRRD